MKLDYHVRELHIQPIWDLAQVLTRASSSEQNHSSVARVALAELQLQDDNASGALTAVASGMGWVRNRREAGYGKLTGTVLALRLTAARAHLALGQIDEADAAVRKLSGSRLVSCLNHKLYMSFTDRTLLIQNEVQSHSLLANTLAFHYNPGNVTLVSTPCDHVSGANFVE